ncbi:MAG TPA: hypothetical protein VI855_02250 [Dehalococcoidia bacterium]|nr:hypothetical protein [Dehalococcoidia bacterium]
MASRDLPQPGNLVFETAAEHICTRVPVASPTSRASQILQSLQGEAFECATDIAICDNGTLVGLLSIEKLLAAPGDRPASELMDADPPVVAPGLDQEQAAWKAVQHGRGG